MNNNTAHERGLLGQFTTSTYVTIGDPYAKKVDQLSRYKKKQFLTNPAIKGRVKEALFGKAFPWLSDGDRYVDKTQYLKTQPRETRKKGFLNSDAMKRDEFMNHIRTEQWRWALQREGDLRKHHDASKTMAARSQGMERPPPIEDLGTRNAEFFTPKHLYDIGKGDHVTPFSQKLPRENWYLANRNKMAPRSTGDWVPSSYEIGNEMVQNYDLKKPQYASVPIIQSTFYRVGSVKANSGWSPTR